MTEKSTLIDLGLSTGEADIYLALLRHGEALTSTLAKLTGAHRTHIYDTLEKLILKGLVNYSIKENRKYYRATNPERLRDHLKEKQDRLEHTLPNLLQLAQEAKGEVVVELYSGVAGMKAVVRDLLNSTKKFFLFGKSRFEEVFPKYYMEKVVREMNAKKIKEFMLLEQGQKVIEAEQGEYRYLPADRLFPTATLIYDNKVAQFIWKQPIYIILIKDEEIAHSYKNHFDLLWKKAKKT